MMAASRLVTAPRRKALMLCLKCPRKTDMLVMMRSTYIICVVEFVLFVCMKRYWMLSTKEKHEG